MSVLTVLLALYGRTYEDVFKVLEFILELGILKHDVFEVALPEIFRETYLIVFLA